MREIKFRAWVKSRSLMAFDVVDIYDDNLYVDGRYYCCFGDILDDDDIILEQFTGLRDKNGREIYEGDIVSHYACGVAKITFSEDAGGFIIGDGRLDWHWASEIAVIGNIHENPELVAKA